MFSERALERSKYHLAGFTYPGRVRKNFGPYLERIHPEVIVDVGCSTGITTRELSEIYPSAKAIGIDVRRLPLLITSLCSLGKILGGKVEYRLADGYRLDEHFLPESIDMLVFMNTFFDKLDIDRNLSSGLFGWMSDMVSAGLSSAEARGVMQRVNQVIRPGGYMLGSWTLWTDIRNPLDSIEEQVIYHRDGSTWKRLFPSDELLRSGHTLRASNYTTVDSIVLA